MKDMDAKMDAFAAMKGTLASGGAAQLLKAYQAYDEIGKLQYLTYRYPQLQRDVDTRDQAVAGRFQRVGAAFAKFATATAWFTPELLAIPEATVKGWIAQTPALAPYRFTILDNYRQKAHVLDDKGERLLSLAGQFNTAPKSIYSELATSDIKFPTIKLSDGKEVVLSPGNYGALLETSPSPGRPRQTRRRRTSAPSAPPPTPTPRSTTACCSATGSWPRRATSRPRSTPPSTATRSRARWSRR